MRCGQSGPQRARTIHGWTYEGDWLLAVSEDEGKLSMHESEAPWAAALLRTAARARETRANFIAQQRTGRVKEDGISAQTSELRLVGF